MIETLMLACLASLAIRDVIVGVLASLSIHDAIVGVVGFICHS